MSTTPGEHDDRDLERPWTSAYAPGVPHDIAEPDEPVTRWLERAAAEHPSRVATDFMGAVTTYAALGRSVARAAGALRGLGVRPGDRVALVLPNCTTHVVAFYAALRIGAVVVEHNPTYTAGELEHQLRDSGATVVISWEKSVEAVLAARASTDVRHVVVVDLSSDLPLVKRAALALPVAAARRTRATMRADVPDAPGVVRWSRLVRHARPLADDVAHPDVSDVALLQYTGGTTGTPKGAVLLHRNVAANAAQGQAWTQHADAAQTVYAALPFFHAFGLTLCLTYAVRIAATVVIFPKFDVDAVLDAQRRRPATFVPGVPPMFERLAAGARASGTDLRSVSHAISGAMSLPAETARAWEEVTGGLLVEGYGMTESSPVALGNPLSPARRPGTLGLPFPSTFMRVVDPEDPSRDVEHGEQGELLVSGPQVFAGYWQRPEDTSAVLVEHGGRTWLRTGDVVVVDDDGFVRLVDRIKEVIITGGFNVYPSQVEDHLRAMPEIEDVAVVGVPGGDLGEKVVAAVVLAEGVTRVELSAVRAWSEHRLARYAHPRELVVVPELPRSQIGKVLRRVVREQVIARVPSRGERP
ncbi:AMP-binding protein [Cellulomonas carbonis]|uniref:Long-chain fatty acid--CoA ligase n=1 Tax=Cellulomonas carbonis T26 TaxID=947969 RepID=A0A0A0BY84_9CELL|nr:AMP-binding protein [Cellulomonas carbonis]KGM12129.1 long-chain fatty acid--CoA ligase [Cellulomonas carbonis T26]GGB97246.1 long-chain-fatty-acid--CoA ligase [Cellulomonas carbonis]